MTNGTVRDHTICRHASRNLCRLLTVCGCITKGVLNQMANGAVKDHTICRHASRSLYKCCLLTICGCIPKGTLNQMTNRAVTDHSTWIIFLQHHMHQLLMLCVCFTQPEFAKFQHGPSKHQCLFGYWDTGEY